jgi:hypothetical protein
MFNIVERMVQATRGVLNRDCNPKTDTVKSKDDTSTVVVEVEKVDEFKASPTKTTEVPVLESTAKKAEEVKPGLLDSFLASFLQPALKTLQALPSTVQTQIKCTVDGICSSAKAIGQACSKYLVDPVVSFAKAATARIPKLYEAGCELLSSCGSWLSSTCSSMFGGLGSFCHSVYSSCKSIINSCTNFLKSLFCERRCEEERKQEEARFEAKLEEKRLEEKRIVTKREETKRQVAKADNERVERIKDLVKTEQLRVTEQQARDLQPVKRSINFTESRIASQIAAINAEISKLNTSSSAIGEVWNLAKSINDKVSQLNQLSADLNSKQAQYQQELSDFIRTADDLKLRHRVSYNAWA